MCLPPGSWAATFNEANFAQQKVSFQLDVGAAAKTLDVQMTESLNTVSGLVSEVIGQYGPAPFSALTAGDITVEDDGPNYCGNAGQSTCPIAGTGFVITAPGNGQYSVTGSGTSGTYFQPGENYSITFKVPGFQPFSENFEFAQEAGGPRPQPDARCRHRDRRRRRRDERQRVADRRRQCVAHSSRAGEHTFALSHRRGRHPVLHERGGPGRRDYGQRRSGYVPERTPGRLPGRRGRVGGGGQHRRPPISATTWPSAAISGCVAVTSEAQPVNAGTIRLHQATTIVITGELESGAGTAPPTYSPTKNILVNFFSGSTATGTPI